MVVSAAAAVQGVKEIADLVRKYNDYSLYEKIVQLQTQVVELTTERCALKDENDSLKTQLSDRVQTVFRNPYYYTDGDEVPLCPRCYETSSRELRVHLTHPASELTNGFGRICRNCKWFFLEGPERMQPKSHRPPHRATAAMSPASSPCRPECPSDSVRQRHPTWTRLDVSRPRSPADIPSAHRSGMRLSGR